MGFNHPKMCPWSTWDEWAQVFRAMYSDNVAHKAVAIDMVCLWKGRGKVSHSVESTANLMEVNVREWHRDNSFRRCSDTELKMLYSQAILRAVNGLVDASQQGQVAESVLMLASRIGIPGWIVDLRHDATHNDLPSLSVLRTASRFMLQWLYDNYWVPQLRHLDHLTLVLTPALGSTECSEESEDMVRSLDSSSCTVLPSMFIPTFLNLVFNREDGCASLKCETSGGKTEKKSWYILYITSKGDSLDFDTFIQRQESEWLRHIRLLAKKNVHLFDMLILRLIERAARELAAAHATQDLGSMTHILLKLSVTLFWVRAFSADANTSASINHMNYRILREAFETSEEALFISHELIAIRSRIRDIVYELGEYCTQDRSGDLQSEVSASSRCRCPHSLPELREWLSHIDSANMDVQTDGDGTAAVPSELTTDNNLTLTCMSEAADSEPKAAGHKRLISESKNECQHMKKSSKASRTSCNPSAKDVTGVGTPIKDTASCGDANSVGLHTWGWQKVGLSTHSWPLGYVPGSTQQSLYLIEEETGDEGPCEDRQFHDRFHDSYNQISSNDSRGIHTNG